MGNWGTALFADDTACDIRDFYRELIENGVDDAEALRQTLEKFASWLDDPDEGAVLIVALAVTQSKIGRLDPGVRDRAVNAIDRGADLDRWEEEAPKLVEKRRKVFEQARSQLTGAQPRRKKLKPPVRITCGLEAGDVLAFSGPQSLVLLRVVRVDQHRLEETPYVEELEFSGTELPAAHALENLPARVDNTLLVLGIGDDSFSSRSQFTAFARNNVGWQEAGFRKVGKIPPRPDDSKRFVMTTGQAWDGLPERIVARAKRETSK